jgi:murein DD-endopeptidase MepM/ murein hydrolase activator NlpD
MPPCHSTRAESDELLPEPLRRLRRLAQSQLLTRGISHLTVVGLVAAAAGFGIAQARGQVPASDDQAGFFSLISTARGAAGAVPSYGSTTLEIVARPEVATAGLPQRGTSARNLEAEPVPPAPLPTPVPVDPDATPLPAPTGATALGATGTSAVLAAPTGAALQWPVPSGSISQYFHSGHLAIDIAASYGNAVVAAEAGVVSSAGWRNNGGGYVVEIDHGNGMRTVYNHLGSIWVVAGQAVARGQGIAGVGCTGMCTGPHVHFEVIVNGVIVNPLRYL